MASLKPNEKQLEALLRLNVRRAGGLTEKLAPTRKGMPDRLVILPGRRMFLIELKAEGGKVSPAQKLFHEEARRCGIVVIVLTGEDQVLEWLKRVGALHY